MVIAFVPLIAIPSLIIPATIHQGFNIWSFIIFAGFFCAIIHNFISCIRRLREPIEIHVDEENIVAILKDGKMVTISWVEVSDIIVKVSSVRKKVTITSKDKSKIIIIYGELKMYDLLIETINKCSSNSSENTILN
ncbi:MAG: hypothetical protein GY928_09760 [Colwellia sp.]|nr:hypothetical protein [Colwellia sp.]